MADLKEVEQALNKYVRPLTFPLALKMLKSETEIPDRTRRSFQQMKKKVAICRGIGMTRKLGCTRVLRGEVNHGRLLRFTSPHRGERVTYQVDLSEPKEYAYLVGEQSRGLSITILMEDILRAGSLCARKFKIK